MNISLNQYKNRSAEAKIGASNAYGQEDFLPHAVWISANKKQRKMACTMVNVIFYLHNSFFFRTFACEIVNRIFLKENYNILMATALRTLQVTLPIADAAFLRRQSRNMGWHVTTIRSKAPLEPKVKMTEAEFRAKLECSSHQAAEGKTIRMRDDETAEQFVNRLICM